MLIGILGFVLAAAVFCGGFALGWKWREVKYRPPTPEELGQEERRRLIQEQKAFRDLMNYNVEMAYGLAPTDSGEEE
jgi:hypothetical protein